MRSACSASSRAARPGRRMRGHGGVLARARSGARQRRALPYRGVHQSHARPPRLSRHHGGLRGREGAPVRLARPGRRIINVDDAFGPQLAARAQPPRRLIVTTRSAQAPLPPGAHFVRAARVTRRPRGPRHRGRVELGHGELPVRLVGEFNVDNVLTVLAVLLAWDIPLAEAARALARVPRRQRAHGDVRRPRPHAARHRRLRAHARCAREGAARRAAALPRAAARRVRLRRRSRCRQAPADGQHRRRARRRHHPHRRQSAQRGSGAHRGGHPRRHGAARRRTWSSTTARSPSAWRSSAPRPRTWC